MGFWPGSLEGLGVMTNFWAGRRVLLTGHTGFKGTWLALWLSEMGAQITGVALEPETTPSLFNQLDLERRLHRHYLADICDLYTLTDIVQKCQPEIVFHLAAQPLVRRSYRDPLGTWNANLQGSLHVLEALKPLQQPCAVVMVTTDKVYENRGWEYGYRENDRLGGHDPYSASKAAAELAIASWRSSFIGSAPHQSPFLAIATARAGNVIGGGDWAEDRIVPDAMRALAAGQPVQVRNPNATRPWQHVLEPLWGYLLLAERLQNQQLARMGSVKTTTTSLASSFNFGPTVDSTQSVRELVEACFQHWPGTWVDSAETVAPHEASRLHLQIDKAHNQLGWQPRWDFLTTVLRTVSWYRAINDGFSPLSQCLEDLQAYQLKLSHVD